MIVWAPATVGDLHRIWAFKFRHNSHSVELADETRDALVRAGEALTATSGSSGPFAGLRKKFVGDYVLVFRIRGVDVQIVGVFHCREDWQGRVLDQRR